MTLSEFKAWFEGFTESMDGAPNKKQFERIKAKVDEINGTPVTPLVIREYYERYRPYWSGPMWVSGGSAIGSSNQIWNSIASAGQNTVMLSANASEPVTVSYPPEAALYDLGKAEYQSIAA